MTNGNEVEVCGANSKDAKGSLTKIKLSPNENIVGLYGFLAGNDNIVGLGFIVWSPI